ncbi:MAG: hypothetical protein HPY71_00165 [Firmicutes bacterium]|nr:hypothetical protein [Bacillota bacterium]
MPCRIHCRGSRGGLLGWLRPGLWLFLLFASIVIVNMGAPAAAAGDPGGGGGPGGSDDYVLGPGDVLEISVWGYEDLAAVVTVRQDGKVSFPLIGDIQASGCTIAQLRDDMSSGIAEYVKRPSVTVILKQPRVISVRVLGEVKVPGVYGLRQGQTVADAIAMAGGLTERGDDMNITVSGMRPSGAMSAKIDMAKALQDMDGRGFPLQDGDTVFVPKTIQVQVMGWVYAPGPYLLPRGARLLDAVARAGGVKPDGDPSSATLTRPQNERRPSSINLIKLDLEKLMTGGDLASNIPLEDGDVIFVPAAVREISVLGEVNRPGVYPIHDGSRLLDAIAAAGGPTPEGDTTCITLVRREGEMTVTFKADLDRLSGQYDAGQPGQDVGQNMGQSESQNDVSQNAGQGEQDKAAGQGVGRSPGENYLLRNGDTIYVPRAIRVQVLGQVGAPGVYRLQARSRVSDVLARAGGVTLQGDAGRIQLTHKGSVTQLSLDEVLGSGDERRNPELADGDILFVPELIQEVSVIGEVAKPGVYPIRAGKTRLVDIIAMAGGPTPEGDTANVRITRKTQGGEAVFIENLDLASGETPSETGRGGGFRLVDDDVVCVPKAIRVQVLGEVYTPGAYLMRARSSVTDAIAKAGGVKATGDGTNVTLTRTRGGVSTRTVIDIDALVNAAGAGEAGEATVAGQAAMANPALVDVTLEDGDILFIPPAFFGVSVLGEVQKPGVYQVKKGSSLLDALAEAGGIGKEGDPTTVALMRKASNEVITVNVERLLGRERAQDGQGPEQGVHGAEQGVHGPEGGPDRSPALAPGDVITVPKALKVQVLGQVQAPGTYFMRRDAKVVDAIGEAGGLKPDAGTSAIMLTQPGRPGKLLSWEGVLSGDPAENQRLSDGDVIFIPEAPNEVSVLGEVAKPGVYRVYAGTRLLDVMAAAGGATVQGDTSSVTVTRMTGPGNAGDAGAQAQILKVDLDALSRGADSSGNIIIKRGDVVYVPKAIQVRVLGQVQAPGVYLLRARSRVMDAIARAGGLKQDGDPENVMLTRPGHAPEAGTSGEPPGDGSSGKGPAARVVNIARALTGDDDGGANPPLADGDTIFVPERIREVTVLGEVARPGTYPIRGEMRVLDAIAAAGGPAVDGDTTSVTLTTRRGGEKTVLNIDLDRIAAGDPQSENCQVSQGDVIYIPRAIEVQVLGQVTSPGSYRLKANSRLTEAIARAGGIKQDGDASRVSLTRMVEEGHGGSRVLVVNVDDILEGRARDADYRLKEGDIISVPEAERRVLVVGEVKQPGIYTVRKGALLMDAIALAGGPTDRAALESVCVFSGGKVASSRQVNIGMDDLLFKGNVKENPVINGGDIVYVPETKKPDWSKVFNFLSGLKLLKDLILP